MQDLWFKEFYSSQIGFNVTDTSYNILLAEFYS